MPARLRVPVRNRRTAKNREIATAGGFHERETATKKGDAARGLAVATSDAGRLRPEHLLALQQTAGNQAVQRLVSSSHGRPLTVQRRLRWDDTDTTQWKRATKLATTLEGGSGVLFVGETDPKEVVVKPGEDMAVEGAMAALLHSEVRGTTEQGGAITIAPGYRVATPAESQIIKAALTPLVQNIKPVKLTKDKLAFLKSKYAGSKDPTILQGQIQKAQDEKKIRAQGLVDKLDEPGVAVQDVAAGQGLTKAVEGLELHTEKRLGKGTKLAKNSPLRIFKQPQTVQALGMTTAVDIFAGNQDRLLTLNPDNLMIRALDEKGRLPLPAIANIDNIYATGKFSSFQTRSVTDVGTRKTDIVTADDTLAVWKLDDDVKALAGGDVDPISKKVFDQIVKVMVARATDPNKTGVPTKAGVELEKVLRSYEERFIADFSKGLGIGKWALVDSIDRMIKNPSRLQDLAPGVDLNSLLTTMKKRRDFLQS
jgi:hypothetical protein